MKIEKPIMRKRLRIEKQEPFNIVLVNPEIPQNTGNIARLCAATGSNLHLVGKLGFSLDEKAVRRAGLDYWHLVRVRVYADFEEYASSAAGNLIFFSSRTSASYIEAPFSSGASLIYGSESTGLPLKVMQDYQERMYGIPTISDSVRSLNLANSVAITLYKGLELTKALLNCKLE